MQSILFLVSLFNSGSLIPPLLFMGMGIVTIIIDLRNWKKERRQGLQHAWHQRIMTLTGVLLIIIGLIVFISTDLVTFSSSLYSALSLIFQFIVVALGIYTFLIIIRSTIRLSTPPQEIVARRINAEQVPIATSPLLLITRMLLIGGTFLLLVLMLLGIFLVFSLITRHQSFLWAWELLIIVPLLAFWLMRMSIRLRTLQDIEQLRFSLAVERSIASFPESAFFSPLSITLRIKRTYIGILAVFIVGLRIPDVMSLSVQFMQQEQGSSLIFWIAFGLIPLILCFIPLFIIRTTVETRENGLRTEMGKFIHWHEAHLFTCYKLPGLIPGDRATILYELSSSSTVLTWRWIQKPQSPLTLWKPLLPLDVYHQRMQDLCDLVIEKTGLQLYNLTQSLEEETTSK